VGIVDASGDKERLLGLLDSYADDPGFSVLVGSTAQTAYGLERGADGFVPSAGNLNPHLCVRLYQAAQIGDSMLMSTLQQDLVALRASYAVDGYISQTLARLKKQVSATGLSGPAVLPPLYQEEEKPS
jgi:4-hydroxy-tetrahydrodipicolinate synthase